MAKLGVGGHDDLILLINAAGLKLIRILVYAVGPHAGPSSDVIRTGEEGVDVVAVQLVQAARVDICTRDGDICAEAMLDSDGRLHVDRGLEGR